ncbi:MAG: LysR family transcriptional regulator [Ruminococcaceae bacterium]|nr:LysR family transcriptional regulator [Oscillospiraceae bacterium]
MVDIRLETFINLCKIGNYTKTAEYMHITQPAVSQHIKFLEEYYGGKLFYYEGKTLKLTERGEILHKYAVTSRADSNKLRSLLLDKEIMARHLIFGATLSIGEFVCPKILTALLTEHPEIHVTIPVQNTENLLSKLREGEIDFALIEGYFDKSKYGYKLMSKEEFIGVCGSDCRLAGKVCTINDLCSERLIIRERGSGTREIFEQFLREQSQSINIFEKISEIGNMNVIKSLVSENHGITFLYKAAAQKELSSGKLQELKISDMNIIREFNLVYLRGSIFSNEYKTWLDYFIGARRT